MMVAGNEYGKIVSIEYAIDKVMDGCTLMVGGFGGVGSPPTLLQEVFDKGVEQLTLICNDTAFPHIGVGPLVKEGRVKKAIVSHIGSNPIAGSLFQEGKMEVEFSPQGILIERIRAGGAGLGGILVDIGMDHEWLSKGKPIVEVDGKRFLLERPLTADVSLVYAKKADPFGNLVYGKSARNTNPLVAMAGNITIAEVEEIVPLGELNPEEIVTPGIFVHYIVKSRGVNWKWAWE
ncbi:CoA transferase subunit A [Anoxybacillus rupiensis]|uniref:CoA transferase subunit A n=1 Tax=Anoxybacteroides rupiense TaxID=311460 RepID=A0ABD5IT08_9BACL|nr:MULTISPECIES: CoA transferase subunit A [Anoxybacillus]MBS2771790.1 CoA transferase subunit A [Anoxybacillus rupiensis]MDE8563844.1 CoA transferase subunit A [Anoxybacillus rupiensis]MED5051438.1 CoA transferase subunit A [Anoxybacillus rupiensis]OQM46037.1 acyl CoA:acetate/3-ketoacid CoA transferase subunit alpha [Anoxybacillus sp. UARK-01]QHC04246.1 3-oxoacid CoA-transferase subunit A [Anoxybacillus sp. PDR2]